jgi:hypothetical protein
MFDYAALSAAELIDLLFKEEDHVSAAHIQELVRRGAEVLPRLREILQNEDYWYEGQGGDFWIIYHAITVLGLAGKPEDLSFLLSKLMDAFYADNHWVIQILPAVFERFGEPAIEPLMNFIVQERGSYKDNQDYAQARYKSAAALARLARAHPSQRERIFNFLSAFYADPQEDDALFLSFAADSLIYLDRKRGLAALRAAYDRKAVSKNLIGSYGEFVASLDNPEYHHLREFELDLLDFYQPKAIAERQRRWKEEAANPEQLYWEPGTPPPVNAPAPWQLEDAEPEVPSGYEVAKTGSVINPGKIGRNDPCPCGSGKKYKKCHGS